MPHVADTLLGFFDGGEDMLVVMVPKPLSFSSFFFFLLNFVDLLSRQAVGGKVLTVNCFPLALNC